MIRQTRSLVFAVLALAMFAAACSSASDESSPPGGEASGSEAEPAEIAPIFSVTTQDGTEFSLSEHLANDGRPVFLNLWASWCFPCREEMPAIDRAATQNPEVEFIGVAVQDSITDAESFANEIGVTYLLAFDADGAVENAYSPLGLPASYIISGEGVIVERIFGKVTEEDLAEKFAEHFG
ncbi:MAG: TlpA disulfide reductase family protein [Acidimicrobiia bacterium]|nr:TlpA disulfide reductase family protein [Acidimicrobiia bacterium]